MRILFRVKVDEMSMGSQQFIKSRRAAAKEKGSSMVKRGSVIFLLALVLIFATALPVSAQSFRVQCPTSTITHPTAVNNNSEPTYNGPTTFTTGTHGYLTPTAHVNGAIKCQQISGGDGFATMGDGTQTYMFSFGPLSGLADIANGLPGSEFPNVFNTMPATGQLAPGDPATADGIVAGTWPGFPLLTAAFTYNGAVGQTPDIPNLVSIYDISEVGTTATVVGNAPLGVAVGGQRSRDRTPPAITVPGLLAASTSLTPFSRPTLPSRTQIRPQGWRR
jgi:hypothetical protein